jgi:serine/threonine protein kinase/DNA-binding SARP family transcriptional activator
MQPERAERIAEIVERALEVEVGERGPLLVDLCGDDQELFVEVASLLHFQEKARDFIETPAVETAAELLADERTGLRPGDSLNGYRIISLVGEGGMGEVYLAQDTKLERKVAIKLLKLGLGTANIIRHFHQEERILAGLTHPNIAQLYGGDVTRNGLPYFVMEYVEGARLDDYCRDQQLSIVDRLELFRKICSAVTYAHQHLVVHRDLKPANIRVTSEREPKLLDFGIAKLLDPATSAIEATMTLGAVMTPDYASPEQVRGENITTTSDVYSLGVILYELLTEQKPYKIDNRTPTAIGRAITDQEPTRPSAAAARHDGSSKSQTTNPKLLRGDLDNIVLRALRKEPDRRYGSVAQFSEDIRRYLEGRPVSARKGTFNYRASKFIKRNKVAVAAATLILLSLVAGILATTFEARRANRRFNDVRRLANSLMFEIHDSVKDLQGSTPTRRLIVSRALEYLDSLASEAGDNASLQRELATAYEKVGDIQGNPFYANLGDTDGAMTSYRKALAIREALKGDRNVDLVMEMGRSYRALGDILEQKGNVAATIENYRRSLSIFQKLAAAHPENFSAQDEFARAYEVLGDGLGRTELKEERLKSYQSALSIRQALLAQKPNDTRLRRSIALNSLKEGGASDPKNPQAIDSVRSGIGILEKLAAADPNNERAYREVGWGYYQLGQVELAAGNFASALESRRKAFTIREKVAAQDPKNVQARFDLGVAHGDLSEALSATGEYTQALGHAQQALSILQNLAAADPTNAVYQRNVGLCYEKFAQNYAGLGGDEKHSIAQRIKDWTEARSWYRKGADLFSALRNRGILMPADSEQPKKFAAKIQECDDLIARLKNSP